MTKRTKFTNPSPSLRLASIVLVLSSLLLAIQSPLDAQHNGIEPALEFNNPGDQILIPGGITVPAGSDFEFSVWLFPRSWEGNNPGLWRAVGNGDFFNIFQGATGRPWIRWGPGNNILQPADGYSVPLNEWTQVRYVITSGESAQFYTRGPGEENWTLRHSANHSVETPEFTFTTYGWQSSQAERVVGIHNRIEFRIDGEPIIQWDLNEGLGASIAGDSSGSGNDGTIEGARWVDTTGASLRLVSEMPFDFRFGSVRLVNVRDDIGSGRIEVGVAAAGELPFTDADIAITSLPAELDGKVALRTANSEASWLFDGAATPITEIEWTYIDAVPDLDAEGNPIPGANTTLADGSGQFQPDYEAGPPGGDGWGLRAFANNGTILQAFGGVLDSRPELKTTIRDLEPGKVYPVTATFWRDPSLWTIRAGLRYGNDLYENELFNPNHGSAYDANTFEWTDSVLTLEGNRTMYVAFLGNAVADENGEIDVFIHDVPTGDQAQRTWYDGVAVGSAPFIRSGTYLAFEVDRDTTVYVINHPSSEPAWLTSSFSATGMTVETTAGTFDVWERAVSARDLIVLPGNGGEVTDPNYWVVLGEGQDAITDGLENNFIAAPDADWNIGSFSWGATSDPEAEPHTASLSAEVGGFNPESGFRLTSTLRVPRLQQEGANSVGFLLLGDEEGDAAVRAEWLPRMSGGGSVIRFVDPGSSAVLAEESWTGLVPTATDNDVGVSAGASEVVFSAGSPVFAEDEATVVFSEDFETGGAGWTTGANNAAVDQWEIGVPTSGPGSAFSGSNVAATNLDGVYTTGGVFDTIAWLRTPEIDLREFGSATLRFHEFLDVDQFELEVDGEIQIFHFATVTVLEAGTLNVLGEVAMYNDEIFSWTERVLDLSVGAGNQIIIEFGLNTDEIEDDVGDGWYIDAVEVTATGIQIQSLPVELASDGVLNGVSTTSAGVDDSSDNYLQFTVEDRGVSGNEGVSVYVAWDVRASGLEPDWLTQNFQRTDHYVGVSGPAVFHRLWAREYANGAEVTLGGASAAGPGAAWLPPGTNNYFVLLGDARTGLDTFYTMEATGAWNGADATLSFTLTDANGFSRTVQTTVSGDFEGRSEFGLAVRHPDPSGETAEFAPIWEIVGLAMEPFEEVIIDFTNFQEWREEHFEGQLDNLEVSGPNANPVGDGVPNLLKYALGLSPWVPAASGDLPRIVPDGNNILILIYQERTDIEDIAYVPQVSEDLGGGAWNEGAPHVVEIFRGPGDSANTQEVRVRGEVSQGAQRGFLRLEVRLVE